MKRTFLTLAVVSTVLLLAALVLGLRIDDPGVVAERGNVSVHMVAGFFAMLGTALVHAIVLTYFMGTGRWLEETTRAYSLESRWCDENQSLKYQTLPWMCAALLLLISIGPLGAMADPASTFGARAIGPVSAASLHYLLAATTLVVNLLVNAREYTAISRNGAVVNEVLAEVRRMRVERGLPVE